MTTSKEKIPPNFFNTIFGGTTLALSFSFLSGKIIPIPRGTPEGGIISAIGMGVILAAMFIVSLNGHWLISKNRKAANNISDC